MTIGSPLYNLTAIEAKIACKEAEIRELNKQRDGILAKTWVTCWFCGLHHMVGGLTYVQTHWYVRPYGCTDGDYWKQGEGQWDCPACGNNNRLYDKPGIVVLKRLFAKVIDCYCETSGLYPNPPCEACKQAGRDHRGKLDRARKK